MACGQNKRPGFCRVGRSAGTFCHVHTLSTSGSRTISRVLSCGCPHQTVIPLGARLPVPSSNLPGRQWSGRPPSLFGLAPNGVCRACRVTTASGGLLPHRFTLTPHKAGRFAFCGAVRGSPLLGVTQRSALWSPDFPPRALRPAATVCPTPTCCICSPAWFALHASRGKAY